MTLPCPGGARGMRGAVSLTVYTEGRNLGWANIFRGKVWSSGEKTASFPRRKVSSCWTWCLGSGSAVPFWGRVYSCWERIASFPGRKVSNCRTRETAWCLDTGSTVPFRGRVYSCQGRIASLPGREVSNGWCGEIAYSLTCQVGLTAYYLTVTLGWTGTFREKVTSCWGIVSFPRRKESNGWGWGCGDLPDWLGCLDYFVNLSYLG